MLQLHFAPSISDAETTQSDYLVEVIQRLSLAKSMDEIAMIVRHAARELVGADGATFVLRSEDLCHYFDEDAIAPLWKGRKFPMETCISGWAMLHKEVVVIEDIYKDDRVLHAAYQPTFVKSLVMTPIRSYQPIGAIGTYWSTNRVASPSEVKFLKALANSTSIAIENVQIVSDLKTSNEALAESIRTRDAFLSVVAHELRTPLGVLQLQLQMTKENAGQQLGEGGLGREIDEDLTLGLRQVSSLSELMERLLDVSRIQLDQLNLRREAFKLDELVVQVANWMGVALKAAGCKLEVELAGDGREGYWDRLRIEQVLTGLLSNACKYASGQSVKIKVRSEENEAVLTVSDGGPGIPSEYREKIFDRFVRAAGPDHVSGLGLGLFIIRSIARAHGGDVQVAPDCRGATFVVTLPFKSTGAESRGDGL